MSKRWSFSDDTFLRAYYDGIGDFIGVHDLGRPKGAATRRVAHLKKTGAWDALTDYFDAKAAYCKALYPNHQDFQVWGEDEVEE
jgi:hypothetical protein